MDLEQYAHLTREELVAKAHHAVPLEKLLEYCNPFEGCWIELETPITQQEVLDCIAAGKAELAETPLWIEVSLGKVDMSVEQIRQNHVAKIAYFATHDIEKPIMIDVGIPNMGCFVEHMVDDGNHRLAGAIVKKSPTIAAWVSGSVEHAQELGLYHPNEFEQVLCARDEAEYTAKAANSPTPA